MKERLLIYRLGSLGDTIVALPCFHKIAEIYPDHERVVLTNFPVSQKAAPIESILGGSDLIHGAIEYPLGTRSPARLYSLSRQLRDLESDTLIYLTPARGLASAWRDFFFFKLCGFKKIIGAPLTVSLQQNRPVASTGEVEPECERLARTVSALGPIAMTDQRNWDLRLTDDEHRTAGAALQPFGKNRFIAAHMGGKVPINDWGAANWRDLFEALAPEFGDFGLVVVGAIDDEERADMVLSRWPGPRLNLSGKLTPRQSGAMLSRADIFVGHDSGPMHLAYSVGCPTVTIFSTNNPKRKWYPYLGQNRVLQSLGSADQISVAVVAQAIRELLGQERPSNPKIASL